MDVEIWEWTEEVEPGYIVWRMVIPGFDKQICLDWEGFVERRGYDPDGEEDMWARRA